MTGPPRGPPRTRQHPGSGRNALNLRATASPSAAGRPPGRRRGLLWPKPLVRGSDFPPRCQRQGPPLTTPLPLHVLAPPFVALLLPLLPGETLADAREHGWTTLESQGTVCATARLPARARGRRGRAARRGWGGGEGSRESRGSAPHAGGGPGMAPFWPFQERLPWPEPGQCGGSSFGCAGRVLGASRASLCLLLWLLFPIASAGAA